MNKIKVKVFLHILMIIGILSFLTNMSVAKQLKENVDYTCINKISNMAVQPTVTPTLKIQSEDKNFASFTPLCLNGKVPKAIYSSDQIHKSDKKNKGFPNFPSLPIKQTASCQSGGCYDYAYSEVDTISNGVGVHLTQEDPKVSSLSIHSLAEIGISTNDYQPGIAGNYIETGWKKDSGDITRLFTYWWKDGTGQCYNTLCSGFVQVSNKYYPGMPLDVDETGKLYAIQTGPSYNWWIYYNDDWVGYYPTSLWNNKFIGGAKDYYYGEVESTTIATDTEMGNGKWASDNSAAKFIDPMYLDSSGWHYQQNFKKLITSQNLYTLEPYFDKYFTGTLTFGGPGSVNGLGGCANLKINNPVSGENFDLGKTTLVTWIYDGCAGPYVKLELFKQDNTLASTITDSTEIGYLGSGNYQWSIPTNLEPGSYKIRLTSSYDPGLNWVDSDSFYLSIIGSNDQYILFVNGTDHGLWYNLRDGSSLSGWISLGGYSTSNPKSIDYGDSSYVFVKGSDNSIWYRSYDKYTKIWNNWKNLGGYSTSDPTLANTYESPYDVLYIFTRGKDGAIYFKKTSDGNTWGDWQTLGGYSTSNPIFGEGIFVKGADGSLWYRQYRESIGWGDWQNLDGKLISDSEPIIYGTNLYVFVRGTDNALWYKYFDPSSGWSTWQSLDGKITSNPEPIIYGTNLYVFARGQDKGLWYRTYDRTSWGQWQSLSGNFNLNISTISEDELYTFVQGVDGSLWFRAFDDTSWNTWKSMGGNIISDISVVY